MAALARDDLAAAAQPRAAHARTASSETVTVPLIGEDPSGVTAQVARSGSSLRRRDPCHRAKPGPWVLGAILMITGVELLVRLLTVPQLGLSLLLGWIDRHRARRRFLIVNERVVRRVDHSGTASVLAVAACGAFVLRKRLNIVGPRARGIVVAFVL